MVMIENIEMGVQASRAELKRIKPLVKEEVKALEATTRKIRAGVIDSILTKGFDKPDILSVMTYSVNFPVGIPGGRPKGLLVRFQDFRLRNETQRWYRYGVILRKNGFPSFEAVDNQYGQLIDKNKPFREDVISIPMLDDSGNFVSPMIHLNIEKLPAKPGQELIVLERLRGKVIVKDLEVGVDFFEVVHGKANLPFKPEINQALKQPKLSNLTTIRDFYKFFNYAGGLSEFHYQSSVATSIL